MAGLKRDNATWLFELLPDWQKRIYRVDDPAAVLTVEVNKGRESMVYLTYRSLFVRLNDKKPVHPFRLKDLLGGC